MTNEMTRNRNNTHMSSPPTAEAVRHAMQAQAAATAGMATEAGDLLKFRQTEQDQWVLGVDEEVVETEKKYVIEGLSISTGFVCWKNGKPVDERVKSLDDFLHDQVAIRAEDLPDHGPYKTDAKGNVVSTEGWTDLVAGRVLPADASRGTDPWLYKPTSYSGRKALLGISQQVLGTALLRHPDFYNPVVRLGASSYMNKNYNKEIFVPEIRIVAWADADGNIMGEQLELAEDGADSLV